MDIRSLSLAFAHMAGGILTARVGGSSWRQAFIFTSVQSTVGMLFSRFIAAHVKNGPQAALFSIMSTSASYLAGILATKWGCEKQISWSSALNSLFASHFAGSMTCRAFMSEKKFADWIASMKP